jgi:hypothetical protein
MERGGAAGATWPPSLPHALCRPLPPTPRTVRQLCRQHNLEPPEWNEERGGGGGGGEAAEATRPPRLPPALHPRHPSSTLQRLPRLAPSPHITNTPATTMLHCSLRRLRQPCGRPCAATAMCARPTPPDLAALHHRIRPVLFREKGGAAEANHV